MYANLKLTALATVVWVTVYASVGTASWTPSTGMYRQAVYRRNEGTITPPTEAALPSSASMTTTNDSQPPAGETSDKPDSAFCKELNQLGQTDKQKYYERIFCSQQMLENPDSPGSIPGGEAAAVSAPSTVTIKQSELLDSTQLNCVEGFEAYHAKERFRSAICIITP
ncbi:hypothetical protein H4R35_003848 [Dimargaris xerosporica]|nr:hypothetical protein H4R35_003848 [Dimargaris xerosporica]